MDGYVPLSPLLAILGNMLFLALLVERFLEFLSWLMDHLWLAKTSTEAAPLLEVGKKMEALERAAHESDLLRQPPGPGEEPILQEIETHPDLPAEDDPDGRFEVKLRRRDDGSKVYKEFYLQLLGVATAILLCKIAGFSAWPLLAWEPGVELAGSMSAPAFWEYVLTGIIVGGGSKPIHFLIEFLVSRKIQLTREQQRQEPSLLEDPQDAPPSTNASGGSPAADVTVVSSIEQLVGFQYRGGDRPGRLENTHLRDRPIDLIVYHHTAMHSNAPFEEVVREFDRKGWLTGYHAVAFQDGALRFICRWDRVGNHAKGHNYHSLGLAFQGNFETDPSVPGSNHNGRFGLKQPTAEQLDAASRLIAFWSLFYGVDFQFPFSEKPRAGAGDPAVGIAPHRYLAATACPGSGFPHSLFQQRIQHYHQQWKDDNAFKTALGLFETTPMVRFQLPPNT